MPRPVLFSTVLFAAALLLTACGRQVASDAPQLLSVEEIAARADVTQDVTRGAREASGLAWRGAQLRERAARLRRLQMETDERADLLRRAEDLKHQQP